MNKESKEIVFFALSLGEHMLCNGGEIYRVEDLMNRVCSSRNISDIDVFATPTIIMISSNDLDKNCIFKRIVSRTTNLEKVSLINNLARKFTCGSIDINQAKMELEYIKTKNASYIKTIIFAGICASCYTGLLNASINDFLVSFIIAVLAQLVYEYSNFIAQSPFLSNIFSGFVIGFLGYFSNKHLNTSIDIAITSSIMPFVPGVALTNSVRDFIYGDLVSGSSRFFEAIMIATSVAVGVSFGISIFKIIF